jgi:hypothetical protein
MRGNRRLFILLATADLIYDMVPELKIALFTPNISTPFSRELHCMKPANTHHPPMLQYVIYKQTRSHLPRQQGVFNTCRSLYIIIILPLFLSNNPPKHNSQKSTPIEQYHITTKKYLDLPYQTIMSFAYPPKNSSANLNTMANSNLFSTFSLCRPNPAPKPACPTCGSSSCEGHGKTFGPR